MKGHMPEELFSVPEDLLPLLTEQLREQMNNLFAVAGLTEWIFHPCCPIACCLLLVLGPLLIDSRKAV